MKFCTTTNMRITGHLVVIANEPQKQIRLIYVNTLCCKSANPISTSDCVHRVPQRSKAVFHPPVWYPSESLTQRWCGKNVQRLGSGDGEEQGEVKRAVGTYQGCEPWNTATRDSEESWKSHLSNLASTVRLIQLILLHMGRPIYSYLREAWADLHSTTNVDDGQSSRRGSCLCARVNNDVLYIPTIRLRHLVCQSLGPAALLSYRWPTLLTHCTFYLR